MKIYVDVVLLINYIFDFILLSSVNYILRRNAKIWRLILGSFIGTITMLVLFIRMSNGILLIFKFLISILMLIGCFGYKDIKYLGKNTLYFYLVSMLMGGGIYFLNSQFSYTNNGLVFTNSGLKLSYLIVIIISILIYLRYMKSFKDLKNHYSNYYKCKIYVKDECLEVSAFLDTGNKLVDPYSNKSIILIQENMLDTSDLVPIYVPYNSLNNHGLLTCYKGLRIEIDGKVCDQFLLGISNENFFIDGVDCILNCQVMEGLR